MQYGDAKIILTTAVPVPQTTSASKFVVFRLLRSTQIANLNLDGFGGFHALILSRNLCPKDRNNEAAAIAHPLALGIRRFR